MKHSESIVHSEGWALPIKHGSGWPAQTGKVHARAAAPNERVAQQKNPALLSPLLTSLFPLGVVGAELRSAADASMLFAGETPSQGAAVPKRIQEFAGGRLCARRALSEFGIVDYPLRINHDRRPRCSTITIEASSTAVSPRAHGHPAATAMAGPANAAIMPPSGTPVC